MSKTRKTVLAVLLVLIALALPLLVNEYVQQILILTITYAMLGLAFAFTLRVGLPRFDIAAWWAIGAYATAMLMWKADMSFWLTIPIGGLVAVLLGYVAFSVLIPRGMMVFLMFGMVLTLAFQQLFGSVQYFGAGEARCPSRRLRSVPSSSCTRAPCTTWGWSFCPSISSCTGPSTTRKSAGPGTP